MAVQGAAETALFLGQNWGFWIQTGAFILSAVGAIAVILVNGRLSRKRATIELILHQKTDMELLNDTRRVRELFADKTKTMASLVENTDSDDCKRLLRVLNSHEFVALGIRKNAFDESIYKMSQCSNVMKVWKSSRGFVYEIRDKEGIETIFQEFEWLATRWRDNPIRNVRANRRWFCFWD